MSTIARPKVDTSGLQELIERVLADVGWTGGVWMSPYVVISGREKVLTGAGVSFWLIRAPMAVREAVIDALIEDGRTLEVHGGSISVRLELEEW